MALKREAPFAYMTGNIHFVLQFDGREIPASAGRYGPARDDEALESGRRIRAGKYSRSHVDVIFKWKTNGRGKSRSLRNNDDDIADALHLAAIAATERAAVSVLLGSTGEEVPVASAILTAIDPLRYTILDCRALHALGNPPLLRGLLTFTRNI